MAAVAMNNYVRPSVVIIAVWNQTTWELSCISLGITENLVKKMAAVSINHYVRLSVDITGFNLQIHL